MMKCRHKLKKDRDVGKDKAVMRCERCGEFFEFDYAKLKIRKIEIEH